MFPRALAAAAVAAGVVLGAIGVVVVPAVAMGGVGFGVFIGFVAATRVQQNPTETGVGTPGAASPRAGAVRRACLVAGGSTIAGWLVLTGVVTLLGQASGSVLLLFGMAAPVVWFWHRLGMSVRGAEAGAAARPGEPATIAAQQPPVIAGELSMQELCLAWRRSYVALLDLPPGPARCEIVRIRECLLDELERRDPDGFTRWLGTGARAGSDPGRYLASDR